MRFQHHHNRYSSILFGSKFDRTFIFSSSSSHFPVDNYNDTYYYLDSSENVTGDIMPNSTSPQDNILITATGWSEFNSNGGNSTDMPLDMVFNGGHRLSIAVYR